MKISPPSNSLRATKKDDFEQIIEALISKKSGEIKQLICLLFDKNRRIIYSKNKSWQLNKNILWGFI